MSYIYKITNNVNDKIYVGKTDFPIEKRFKQHCQDANRRRCERRPLYAAMRKYGIEHFHIELIEETDKPEEREIYWIQNLKGYTVGYNATKGGDGKYLYDHNEILTRLKEHPYPCDVANEFGCGRDLVYTIAQQNHISVRNKGNEIMRNNLSKSISAYTKTGEFVKSFSSVSEAAQWCAETGKSTAFGSGVRGHIAEAANGKRKSAYSYIWKYNEQVEK